MKTKAFTKYENESADRLFPQSDLSESSHLAALCGKVDASIGASGPAGVNKKPGPLSRPGFRFDYRYVLFAPIAVDKRCYALGHHLQLTSTKYVVSLLSLGLTRTQTICAPEPT